MSSPVGLLGFSFPLLVLVLVLVLVCSLGRDQHEQILVMLGAKEQELASLMDRIGRNGSQPLSGIDVK